jgi:hypothetical protein
MIDTSKPHHGSQKKPETPPHIPHAAPANYDPPDEWWRREPFKHTAENETHNVKAYVYGLNVDVVVITVNFPINLPGGPGPIHAPTHPGPILAGTTYFADWAHNGFMGIPLVADQIVVGICGVNGFDTAYLYGLKNDGSGCVVCWPVRGQAQGRITPVYVGDNTVVLENLAGIQIVYRWTGADWIQSVAVPATHKRPTPRPQNLARLIKRRAPGAGIMITRQETIPVP